MAKNTNSTTKRARKASKADLKSIAAEMATNDAAAPQIIDHHTQIGSWAHSYLAQHEIDTSMPMGENGNELVETIDEFVKKPKIEDLAIPAIKHVAVVTDQTEAEVLETVIEHLSDENQKDISAETSSTDELNASDLAAIEALELHEEAEVVSPVTLEAEPVINESVESEGETEAPAQKSFKEIVSAITSEEAIATAHRIATELDERLEFQREKNPDNTSIVKTLESARKELVTGRAARLLMATNVSPGFINRVSHEGSRYNVYAFGKLADLARAMIDGDAISNAINRAVVRSLFACKKSGVTFTLELAKAAASDKIRVSDPIAAKSLFRHTVSASTAPTQASSTMQALETLGIVRVTGSRKHPAYEITSTPAARHLEEMIAAAAAA